MIKHMKLGDMPQFCETVKAWLNERYGEEQGAAIWRATAAQHPAALSVPGRSAQAADQRKNPDGSWTYLHPFRDTVVESSCRVFFRNSD